jgi:hypothetical protein
MPPSRLRSNQRHLPTENPIMNPNPDLQPGLRRGRWLRGLALGLSALALMVLGACGGGVGSEGTGTGAQPAYTQGAISGFGSIVVNGVHYDESQAGITDEDGAALGGGDLKLGMVVRIDSSSFDANAQTAVATKVTLVSDLSGPVDSKDLVNGTLTVLGQTVRLGMLTVVDDRLVGGLAQLQTGTLVQVHAIYDPVTGIYVARRIEFKSSLSGYRIRGLVHGLDLTTRSFLIGTQRFSYSADSAPAGLADNTIFRFKLGKVRDGAGSWQVQAGQRTLLQPADGNRVEVESVIASFTSTASFTVDGLSVDARQASIKPAGGTLAAGVRAEIKGRMSGAVLLATAVEIKSADDDNGGGQAQEIELKGSITAGSLDRNAKTFVLRGSTVSFAGAVTYDKGTEADLADNKKVEVKGLLSADRTRIDASEIKFDN